MSLTCPITEQSLLGRRAGAPGEAHPGHGAVGAPEDSKRDCSLVKTRASCGASWGSRHIGLNRNQRSTGTVPWHRFLLQSLHVAPRGPNGLICSVDKQGTWGPESCQKVALCLEVVPAAVHPGQEKSAGHVGSDMPAGCGEQQSHGPSAHPKRMGVGNAGWWWGQRCPCSVNVGSVTSVLAFPGPGEGGKGPGTIWDTLFPLRRAETPCGWCFWTDGYQTGTQVVGVCPRPVSHGGLSVLRLRTLPAATQARLDPAFRLLTQPYSS